MNRGESTSEALLRSTAARVRPQKQNRLLFSRGAGLRSNGRNMSARKRRRKLIVVLRLRIEEYFAHAAAHFIEDQTIPESFLSSVPLLIGAEAGGRITELVAKELKLPLPITVFKGRVKEVIADFYANPVSLILLQFWIRVGVTSGFQHACRARRFPRTGCFWRLMRLV